MNEYVKIFNESESEKKKRINNRERKVRKVNIPQVTNTKKFSQHSKKTKKTIANEYELDSKSLDDETKL